MFEACALDMTLLCDPKIRVLSTLLLTREEWQQRCRRREWLRHLLWELVCQTLSVSNCLLAHKHSLATRTDKHPRWDLNPHLPLWVVCTAQSPLGHLIARCPLVYSHATFSLPLSLSLSFSSLSLSLSLSLSHLSLSLSSLSLSLFSLLSLSLSSLISPLSLSLYHLSLSSFISHLSSLISHLISSLSLSLSLYICLFPILSLSLSLSFSYLFLFFLSTIGVFSHCKSNSPRIYFC